MKQGQGAGRTAVARGVLAATALASGCTDAGAHGAHGQPQPLMVSPTRANKVTAEGYAVARLEDYL